MTTTQRVRPPQGARSAVDPRVGLAVAVLVGLAAEVALWAGPYAAGQDAGHVGWVALAALAVGGCLAVAITADAHAVRTGGAGLRPVDVTAAGVVLLLGLLAVRSLVGGVNEGDLLVYQAQGAALVDTGALPVDPPSEYPALAVISFAAVVLVDRAVPLGFGAAFGLVNVVVCGLTWWLLARRVPPWAVAATAVWPTVAVFALVRYDALPTLLLVAGLLAAAATRSGHTPGDRRAGAAGLLLGLGAALKWFPGLAAAVLAVGWWRAGRRRAATVLTAGTAVGFGLPHLPFALDAAQRDALLGAYTFHADRVLTGESLPFLPLHAVGLAELPARPWGEVPLAAGAQPLVTAALVLAVLVPLALAVWRPDRALAWAVVAPIAFFAGNRIFSPQFVLPILTAWAVLTLGTSWPVRRRIAAMGLAGVAATANWGIWPTLSGWWVALSWVMFGALAALVALGLRDGPPRVSA